MIEAKPPFDRVVEAHGRVVLRVCRAVLGPVDAEDAWSETFLAALRAWPALPAEANVQAWLVTIAQRKAIDLARARSRQPVPTEHPPEVPGGIAAADPDGRARLDADLVAAVVALPDRQRHAVVYHYLGELPYAEVAAVMGGSADAVRRAAADGIAKLRRHAASSSLTPQEDT